MNWEERKIEYTKKANSLSDVPKDLKYFSKFNILKMAVMEKVDRDIKSGKIDSVDAEGLFTIRSVKDEFGFTERYLNVMMHYAYIEGVESVSKKFSDRAADMNSVYDKMVELLDSIDKIEYNEEKW